MAPEAVLFVDDEDNILNSLERLFIDGNFVFLRATSGAAALELIRQRPVAMVVSDHCMPGMNGVELLSRVRAISPETVRVLMTAHADFETAVAAINQGEIFRFLSKPWNDAELKGVVIDGLFRYRLAGSMRSRDDSTLRSLGQMVELKDPYTKGHCDRVADYAQRIAADLPMNVETLKEIRYGSWLHDCGKVGVPEEILNFPGPLNAQQYSLVKNHSQWGAEVALQARLAPAVVNIIRHHHERYDGKGYPWALAGEAIPVEARIVSIADVFDAMTSDRPYQRKLSFGGAMEMLERLRGTSLDPELTGAFLDILRRDEDSRGGDEKVAGQG